MVVKTELREIEKEKKRETVGGGGGGERERDRQTDRQRETERERERETPAYGPWPKYSLMENTRVLTNGIHDRHVIESCNTGCYRINLCCYQINKVQTARNGELGQGKTTQQYYMERKEIREILQLNAKMRERDTHIHYKHRWRERQTGR